MPELHGIPLRKNEILRRVGDISQICGVRSSILADGRGEGVRTLDVTTGSGLSFSVLPSRGMDIAHASWRGTPFGWISPVGISSPSFFQPEGYGFLRNFTGGLLTTCGMTHASHPCEDEGERLGLHGRVSNIPAEDVSILREWHGDEYRISVSGRVREVSVFGENLVLNRTISTTLGAASLTIADRIENAGFRPSPLMMLYHVNIGWPILSEHARLHAPSAGVIPMDDRACEETDSWSVFGPPQPGYQERVYRHDLHPAPDGTVGVAVANERLGLGVFLRYPHRDFPHFIQWKMTGEGEYVLGIEPGNITGNRAEMRRAGTLEFLEPGADRTFTLEIGVLDGVSAIHSFIESIGSRP